MAGEQIKVLLVEDNLDYASILQVVLSREPHHLFSLTHVKRLSQAITELAQNHFNVILLDLSLPDSDGFDTFFSVYSQAPESPVVVLTALDDEALAIRAVREGAQDYLIKGGIEGPTLVRSLRYAIERHKAVARLQHLSLLDDLTGLLNRRGFITIAKQHMKIAKRANRELTLFFADLDGLKYINDRFGHHEGDHALTTIAAVMKATFRSSDAIARIGGDEFVVLAVNTTEASEEMIDRLEKTIAICNHQNPRYRLSLSIGVAHYDPQQDNALEELLAMADQDLYTIKRSKHTT